MQLTPVLSLLGSHLRGWWGRPPEEMAPGSQAGPGPCGFRGRNTSLGLLEAPPGESVPELNFPAARMGRLEGSGRVGQTSVSVAMCLAAATEPRGVAEGELAESATSEARGMCSF